MKVNLTKEWAMKWAEMEDEYDYILICPPKVYKKIENFALGADLDENEENKLHGPEA